MLFQVRCFSGKGIYRRKIREKPGFFVERKSVAKTKKARKCWAFHVRHQTKYESSFVVNGGELFLEGRKDYQIKVNGVRIEPVEIEAVAMQFQEVKDSVVLALFYTTHQIINALPIL